jgi:phenylacetate-CoA ligase
VSVELARDLDVLTRAEIESLRAGNFAAVVDAVRRSPAARHVWAGIDEVREPADLPKLPLFGPRDLEATCPPHTTELVLDGGTSGIVIRSSGTSGRRKVLYHSWAFNDQVTALGLRGLRGLSPAPQRIANCLQPGELNGGFSFVHDVSRAAGVQALPIGSTLALEETAEIVAEHRVDTLVAAPSVGMAVLSAACASGPLEAMRHFLYIGEPLGDEREKRLAELLPHVRARSFSYSTSETGPIGYQCPHQRGSTHHVHEDAVVVEVVDEETGQPLPLGEVGEIVVTTISDSGMPLFRYRVGDRGRVHPGPCACGSEALSLTLAGRVAEITTIDSTTVSRDLVMTYLAPLGIHDSSLCQVQIVERPSGFSLRLLVAPGVAPDLTPADVMTHLAKAYSLNRVFTKPRFRGFAIETASPDTFDRTPRGKTPFFVHRSA